MQPHRNAEDVRVAVEGVTLVVNVLNAGSEAKIADDAFNSAGRLGEADLMRVLPIMTALDADGNGEISDRRKSTDAVAALRKLDKNKDDKLTAEELRPSFGGNRGGRGGSGIPDRSPCLRHPAVKATPAGCKANRRSFIS